MQKYPVSPAKSKHGFVLDLEYKLLSDRASFPKKSVIYFAYTIDSGEPECLYVGQTKNLYNRWLNEHEKERRFRQWQVKEIRIAWIDCVDDYGERGRIEAQYIELLQPIFNGMPQGEVKAVLDEMKKCKKVLAQSAPKKVLSVVTEEIALHPRLQRSASQPQPYSHATRLNSRFSSSLRDKDAAAKILMREGWTLKEVAEVLGYRLKL